MRRGFGQRWYQDWPRLARPLVGNQRFNSGIGSDIVSGIRRKLIVRVAWLFVGLALVTHASARAGEGFEFNVGGLLFGDLYSVPSHHLEDGDGAAGVDFGNETGDGRKWMGALTWKPATRWTVDLYADYEILPGPTDRSTLQAFIGDENDGFRWGAQYSYQDRQDDPTLELASAFVIGRVGKKTNLVGRVDRLFQPSPAGNNISYLPFDPSAPATFFIAGVEFQINPHLKISPNTVVTTYDHNDEGVRQRTDVYLRLTFFLNLE